MNRLRLLREELGLSQGEVADIFEISQSVVSKWERGLVEADREMLIKMSRYFNVSIDYLLENSNRRDLKDVGKNDLLRDYLADKFGRSFDQEDINIIEKIIEMVEKYRE